MKIRIEIDQTITEEEVIIRCARLSDRVNNLQTILLKDQEEKKFVFYKDDTEFFLPIDEILFFETSDNQVWAHTKSDEYQVKLKLYELENSLPGYFMRVSKSSVLNIKKVYSISKNLTASSKVEFFDSHKVVYVSRNYYKALKEKMSLNTGK